MAQASSALVRVSFPIEAAMDTQQYERQSGGYLSYARHGIRSNLHHRVELGESHYPALSFLPTLVSLISISLIVVTRIQSHLLI